MKSYKNNLKYILSLLFIISFLNHSIGQNSLEGIIIDSLSQSKLENCSISLQPLKTNDLLKGTTSNEYGFFTLNNISIGNYFLVINYLGYKPYKSLIQFVKESEKIKLNQILLTPSTTNLDEVVVKVKKNRYKQSLDKLEVKFNKEDIKKTPKLMQALQKISGVVVDVQRKNISLLGSENVLLLVNGVEKSTEEIAMLKTIEIERVEIIDNPGVQHSSTYSSVLNIIKKKKKELGLVIDADVYGFAPYIYNFSNLKIQYGFDKVKLYSYYSLWYRGSEEESKTVNTKEVDGIVYEIEENIFDANKRLQIGHFLSGGVDLTLNKKSFINISSNYGIYEQEIPRNLQTLYFEDKEFLSEDNWRVNQAHNKTSINYSLYYKYDFNKNNNLYAVANIYHADLSFEDMNNLQSEIEEVLVVNTSLIRNKKSQFYKINYNSNLSGKYEIETGISTYYREMGSEFVENGVLQTTTNYNEIRTKAFLNLKTNFNKIAFSAGIALENQISEMNSSDNKNSNLLPSLNMQYKINKKQNLKLSYSKRLNYPNTYQLSDYIRQTDNVNIYVGNPNIKSFATSSVMSSYAYRSKGFFISPSLSYSYVENPINNIIDFAPNNTIVHTYDNIGNIKKWMLRIRSSFSLGKVKLNPSIVLSNDLYDSPQGKWGGNHVVFNFSPDYTFKNGINISSNFYYKSKKFIYQGFKEVTPSLDFTISKNYFDGDLSVLINVNPFDDKYTNIYSFNDVQIKRERFEHYKNINIEIIYTFRRGKRLKNIRKHLNKDKDF